MRMPELKYRSALIPKARKQRPGYAMVPTSMTMHNTANPGATAADHAKWLGRTDTKASFHIAVDDAEAVLLIPLTEQAWHTGTNAGNTTSIGIEVCEFDDPERQAAADRNAMQLVADMLTGRAPAAFTPPRQLALGDLRTHQSWHQYGADKPGKYCPHLLLGWWDAFVAGIAALMAGQPVPTQPADPGPGGGQPLLRRGSTGEAVSALQRALNARGAGLVVDGQFGPATEAAVRNFQAACGLVVDGIVGPLTQAQLANQGSAPVPVPTQPAPSMPTVRYGSRGSAVRTLQVLLNNNGARLRIDGVFGSRTKAAVVWYQRKHGLAVDGIVGPRTWAALGR